MTRFFTQERFSRPQWIAGTLLLIFLAQCVWLVSRDLRRAPIHEQALFRLQQGLRQWHGQGIAGTPYCGLSDPTALNLAPSEEFRNTASYDRHHSPLWYLTASGALVLWTRPLQSDSMADWGWLAHAPSLVFALLLGASLWYVSRRLYGNMGGYIALTLYCFSPGIIRTSALWFAQPENGAAWGAFGAIFTAVAVAHTLYAPREVVMWNWRRIGLLGLSLALAIGSQFSLIIIVPLALAFMLYLAPARRGAVFIIWLAACAIAVVLLFASYAFHPKALWEGIQQASFFGISWPAFAMRSAYLQVLSHWSQSSAAVALSAPAALLAYLVWPRARYFGNHAPLLVAVLFFFLAVGTPHYPGFGFQFLALPFLFVFISGVCADLLETRQRSLVMACIWGLLSAQAIWSFGALSKVG